MEVEREAKSHSCVLCQLDPSEWSYFALMICAVAAAWKVENPQPKVVRSVPTLAGIAGTVVQRECK